jgi:lysophospholipase L1-like esterase
MQATPTRRFSRSDAIVALVATVLLSACGWAALVHAALHYFEASETIRLDPGGLKMYAGARATAQGDRPVLVFFGDSRAFMWPEPAAPLGYRIVNRGISYQTTAQMLLRIDADVGELHPTVVVFEGGINDLKTIASFPERRSEIVADCEANLERIVEICSRAGAEVVLTTVFNVGDVPLWRRPFWSSDVASAVRELNAFLPRLTGARVVLFDANSVLVDERGDVRAAYQLDYLHLSAAGYAALNQKLVPLLSALPR